ncbi:MAG: thioredoxin-disulfide reductase [Eubacteriaceae bacterium]
MYDALIIGGGPGGLSAGLYAARGALKTMIIEKGVIGGQIINSWEVENYPGSPEKTTGPSLIESMKAQCVQFGVEFTNEEYQSFEKTATGFKVKTDRQEILTKTLIIATGAEPRLIGCKGEKELRGMGVSYCATCDANFFTGLKVAVVGGGDTALEEALYLTKFAKQVTIIHRRDAFRGAKVLQNRAKENEKIDFLLETVVEEIKGNGMVEAIVVKNVKSSEVTELPMDGVFVYVGQKPMTEKFIGILEHDAMNYLITDEEMRTNIHGIFAVGDVRRKSLRQVVTAAGDGAIAGVNAIKYIEEYA